MRYTIRCEKHKIFIGKDGCKICNELKEIANHANNYFSWHEGASKENSELKLLVKLTTEVLTNELSDKQTIYKENEHLKSIATEHYDMYMSECLKNDKLRKKNENLKFDIEITKTNSDAKSNLLDNLYEELAELKKENQRLKSEKEHIEACNNNNFRHYNDQFRENNILQQRKQFYKSRIEQLESAEVPEIVKFATKYLTRNEKQIMINLLGAQSMLAVLVDHFNKIPENRKLTIEPLYDYVINICEKVDYLNAEIAKHMAKQIVNKEFENIITDVASVCDFMAGKITKCKTCTAWLDNKAKNRRL